MSSLGTNWTTPILQEIAAAESLAEQYLKEHNELSKQAWEVGPSINYPEFSRLYGLAQEKMHLYGLEKYRIKSLRFDLDFDLGRYDDDPFNDCEVAEYDDDE